MSKKLLVAFDFDNTIIDGNSDTIVRELLLSKPQECKASCSWTEYMQNIFNLLHKQGVDQSALFKTITNIPATTGMIDLLCFLNQPNVEIIIISDSNSIFISVWLQAIFGKTISVSKIYTNEAVFDSSGLLNLSMYHDPPQDWCKMCPKNLCKGFVLAKYLKEKADDGTEFSNVAYIGDGQNDFCPCTKLQEPDYVFPRKGYYLDKILDGSITKANLEQKVKATVLPWDSATNIQKNLSEVLKHFSL